MTNAVNLASLAVSGALSADANGNVGLGVTPSPWGSGAKAIQVNSGGAAISALSGSGALNVTANCYYNGTNWIYSNSYFATRYFNDDGNHIWYTAPSGTAGNAVSFTQIMQVSRNTTLALQGATSQTGTGITFPAVQNASSNANTLDDYEEGTYTPQIVVEGGNPLSASTVYEGSFTKIGNTVRVTVHAVWNNVTAAGGTSAIQLHNFPFPFALTSNAEGTQAYGTHFSTGIAGLNQVLNLRPVQNNVTWCYLYGFWGTTLPQSYGYLRVNSNPITNGTAMTLQFVIVYRTTQ